MPGGEAPPPPGPDGPDGATAALCRLWGLEPERGAGFQGFDARVLPVRRGAERCVLKITRSGAAAEAAALLAWGGRGAVRLLAARPEPGALLLERLDAGRSLRSLPAPDAAAIAGRLLRRLAIPAPAGLPRLRETSAVLARSLPARQQSLGCPVPPPWLEAAVGLCRELGPGASDLLVHGDLHHDNVLLGTREAWLAIDPKPVAGDPEYGVGEPLWTAAADPRRLLSIVVDAGGLDAGRARGWAIVRAVDYWLWGLENGLTEDPRRCRRVVEALL